MSDQPPPVLRGRFGTMWFAVWLATVAAAGLAVFGCWQLTSETFEASLDASLGAQVRSQATMAAALLDAIPPHALARDADDDGTAPAHVIDQLAQLRDGSGLERVALIAPDGHRLDPDTRPWSPPDEDLDALAAASAGRPTAGPIDQEGERRPFLTAYAPLPQHAGWVVAVVTSGEPLDAAEDMEATLAWVSVLVMTLAAGAGALLAATAVRPLPRLARELAAVRPGDPPGHVSVTGPVEVRQVAEAARSLLDAVQQRDLALRSAHDREVHQVSAMAAAVAHEVRNPLNAIGLAVERLQRPGVDTTALWQQVRSLLGEIEDIVTRFIDLARPPEPHPSSLHLSTLWRDLAVDAEAVGVALTTPASEEVVTTDPALLRQALRHLVRNAAEAGASTVHIDIRGRAPVVLEVSDDGPGIPEDAVPRLFDWFYTTRARGSGLGLPSARRLLGQVGADLELVDARDARFRIALGSAR